jgi:Fe-S cluster assembly protein SufD
MTQMDTQLGMRRMVEVMTKSSALGGSLDTLARDSFASAAAKSPAWLRSIRESALARFVEMGLPTTRDEEWRFTNIAPLAKAEFQLAEPDAKAITPEQVRQFAIPNLTGIQLVFVDGVFAPRLSNLANLPRGVEVRTLSDSMDSDRRLIEPLLKGHDLHASKADAFAWLNAAMMEDGAFIHVRKGAAIEQPIQLLSIATSNEGAIVTHPRNIIIAEEQSEMTVLERYVSLKDGEYFTNAITDVVAADNAVVHHYLIEEESTAAFNVSALRIRQTRNSNVDSHTVLLGGRLVRNNVHAILDGEGANCLINGLYVGGGEQHMDNHMRVEHAKPHGDSRQFYKGILDDRASGVFAGRIIVHKDAQKTDAKQTNKNLLLSDDAHVDTKPQLEIYADDVKCTHGATIGQLNDEAIFYLRARGIALDSARSMLIHSFAGESLERMKLEPVRTYLDKILFKRLPGGELLESMV